MSSLQRITFHWLTILGCIALATPAASQEIPKVNIGVVLPMTGAQAAFGHEIMRGIEVAQDQFATAAPDWAARVTIKKGDDGSLPDGAKDAATKLLNEQRTHAIIGSVTAANTIEIEQVARKANRVVISPISTSTTIDKAGWAFPMTFSESSQGTNLAELARKNLKTKRAAIIRHASPEAEAMARAFKTAYEAKGGQVLGEEIYEPGTTDFRPLLKKLRNVKPQAVLVPAAYSEAATIMNQAQTLGYRTRFLGGDNWDTPALARMFGPGPSRAFHLAHFAADDPATEVSTFVAAFKEKFGRPPGAIAALGFDAFSVTVYAFQKAGSTLKTPVRRAFERVAAWRGTTGTISFNSKANASKSVIVKAVTQSGAEYFARIGEPAAPAGATTP